MITGAFPRWLSKTWFGFLSSRLRSELGDFPNHRSGAGNTGTTTSVHSEARLALNARKHANDGSLDERPLRKFTANSFLEVPGIGVL